MLNYSYFEQYFVDDFIKAWKDHSSNELTDSLYPYPLELEKLIKTIDSLNWEHEILEQTELPEGNYRVKIKVNKEPKNIYPFKMLQLEITCINIKSAK